MRRSSPSPVSRSDEFQKQGVTGRRGAACPTQTGAGHHGQSRLFRGEMSLEGLRRITSRCDRVGDPAARRPDQHRHPEPCPFGAYHRQTDDDLARYALQGRDGHRHCCRDGRASLDRTREIIAAFHGMIRRKVEGDLRAWIARGRASLVASFANGVDRDISAVRAAITSGWSTARLRAKSPSSSSPNARCTAVESSTFWRPGSSATPPDLVTKDTARRKPLANNRNIISRTIRPYKAELSGGHSAQTI
jgi:hypothetical protein